MESQNKEDEIERWMKIKNLDDYLVSNKGRVKNIKHNWILKPSLAKRWFMKHEITITDK